MEIRYYRKIPFPIPYWFCIGMHPEWIEKHYFVDVFSIKIVLHYCFFCDLEFLSKPL